MKKLRTILLTIPLITLGLVSGTAEAAIQHINEPVCSLAVYPYDPNTPEIYGNAGTALLNFLSEATCAARTTYGSPYNQPPTKAQNPLKSGISENKNVPYAIHEHTYINNSLEDNYYYRSYIDKFEIKLQSDALNNTEKTQIQCQTPAPGSYSGTGDELSDCNGSINDTNFYGGVKVSYNSTTGVVTWEFGTMDKTKRPNMWGNNDSNPADSDNFNEVLSNYFGVSADLSDYNSVYRSFTPKVQLKTKNNSTDIWSGTTTSRILIRNYAILKSSFNALPTNSAKITSLCSSLGDYTKWCPVDTPAGQGYATEQLGNSGQQQWFWFPIGSVVSVWSKPAPAPQERACTDLQWDGAFLKKNGVGVFAPTSVSPTNGLLAYQAALMKTKATYEAGSGPKRPLELIWTAYKDEPNRPTWFKNEDTNTIFIYLGPIITSSLPYKLINAAHAAPLSPGLGTTPAVTPGSIGVDPSLLADGIVLLGKFKDEIASTQPYNPLTDDDFQAYYSGGSEGVTVGVQAFYSDGKKIGSDPQVLTPDGLMQKALNCHLEFKIQPPPAVCIDLDISPKDIKPNTPVTFTVTPKFNPSTASIPLNYLWNATKSSGGIGPVGPAGFDPSQIGPFDPGMIPGGLSPGGSSGSGPSWWGDVVVSGADTAGYLGNLLKDCPGPGCPVQTKPADLSPLDPIANGIDTSGVQNAGLGSIGGNFNPGLNPALGASGLGTNIFSADGTKIAALPPKISTSTSIGSGTTTSAAAAAAAAKGLAIDATPSAIPADVSPSDLIDKDAATMDEILYGGFKDYKGGPLFPTNPYLETTDNKTYYTGGPAGTLITVQGIGKDGTVYPPCKDSLVIPALPSTKCQVLKVKFMDGATEVSKDALQPGKPYTIVVDKANSKKEDGTLITKYDIRLNNADGPGAYGTLAQAPGNAASCSDITGAAGTIGTDSTSVDCKYVYTPKAKDHLKVEADPTDGVALCTVELTVPEIPVGPICKAINLTTTPVLVGGQIPLNTQIALTTDPRDTDNNPRNPVFYEKNGSGVFINNVTNAASCPTPSNAAGLVTFEAPSSCKYSFLATTSASGDYLSVKVKQDDGVANCKVVMPIKPAETPEMCLALNFRVNGAYTLNPSITPGNSYTLSADPQTNKGNPIGLVEWSENGPGKLVGDLSNPAICPAAIDNGNVTTPSFCRYIFSSPAGSTGIGFSAHAVPDDGNVNCMAKAEGFTPPVVTPYCLYLDLDTSGTFNPLASNNMNATVVMSDGSKYNDNVRFVSTDGFGNFTGGYTAVLNNNTSNFRTNTDATNNTHNVNFSNGKSTTGINVMLADTSITQTAACQRSLSPTPQSEKCTTPPNITKKSDTQYCAEGGDSKSYCWTITGGSGNPLFSNGTHNATGNCVSLNAPSDDFKLQVEDCNPAYANICYDNYKETPDHNPPKLEKRISKDMVSFGRQVNYSTKGSVSVPVYYKLSFYPYNYESGKNMTVTIHDPAFTGTIYSHTTDSNGKDSSKVGTIKTDLTSIVVKQGSNTYDKCSSGYNPLSDCYEIVGGALVIHGIQSNEVIQITYKGNLTSAITAADCQEGKVCNEQFINQSYATEMKYCHEETNSSTGEKTYPCDNIPPESGYTCSPVTYYDSTGKLVTYNPCSSGSMTVTSEKTIAELVCQYFLTRASGDIFLEDQLRYGIDVSKCYPFKNISSTITKPIPERPGHLIKTGTESGETVTINHEICSAGQGSFQDLAGLSTAQKKALSELYGADLTTLSSQICEVGLVPGVQWTKEQISKAIEQNVGKLTRWDDGTPKSATLSSVTDIINNGRVYYFNGDTSGSKLSISGLDIPDNSGPITIVVENADLYIDGDIKYSEAAVDNTANLASLGVIVLNGNMYVSNNVKQLDGAYFVQRTDNADLSKGNVLASPNEDTDNLLTVSGSIFGNIGPIFSHRVGAGDIAQDQGAITIRYDQRIIQNPPAGLAEILGDLSSGQIAQ